MSKVATILFGFLGWMDLKDRTVGNDEPATKCLEFSEMRFFSHKSDKKNEASKS